MLAGVSLRLKERLDVTETTRDEFGGEDILLAAENLGEANRVARQAADSWLEGEMDMPSQPEAAQLRPGDSVKHGYHY